MIVLTTELQAGDPPLYPYGFPTWFPTWHYQPTYTAPVDSCHHCGMNHSGACPRVQEIEYHENGTVKRVVYK